MKLLKKIFDSEMLLLVVMILAITLIGVTRARADNNSPVGTSTIMFPDFPTDYEYEYYTVCSCKGNDGKTYYRLILSNNNPPLINTSNNTPYFYGPAYSFYLSNDKWVFDTSNNVSIGYGVPFTFYYFNYDLVRTTDNSVFQLSPLKSQVFLATKVGTLKVILTTLISLATLLVVSLISWIGLRKCWTFLLKALRIS